MVLRISFTRAIALSLTAAGRKDLLLVGNAAHSRQTILVVSINERQLPSILLLVVGSVQCGLFFFY